MGKCEYIYKKGSKKGLKCNKHIDKEDEKMCVLHKNKSCVEVRINTPNDILNKILELNTTTENKNIILKYYQNMTRAESNSSEYYKNQLFIERILDYPWKKSYNIKDMLNKINIKELIDKLKYNLDKEIYGMENVKDEIINLVCKLITNPNGNRNNIALYGVAGVGKSKFIKVLSNVLGLPMKTISLGGIKDSSFLLGHSFIYVESGPGKIIQNIIDSKINNPILMFDELDKVSESDHGKDIFSSLCYLTDSTQNMEFIEHYFYGIKFDLSRVFYIFTFNDISKIDNILLDRLNVIHVNKPKHNDILIIIHEYCIPEIIKNIGIKKRIIISQDQVQYVINHLKNFNIYNPEYSSGIREIYRIFEKIFLYINKDILLDNIQTDIINISNHLLNDYILLIKSNYNIIEKYTHLYI